MRHFDGSWVAAVLVVLIVSNCCTECPAQETKLLTNYKALRTIDSLERKLANGEVEDRFSFQLNLYGRLYQLDTVKAAYYLKACAAIANESGDSLLITRAVLAEGHFLNARSKMDKALLALKRGLGIARRNGYKAEILYLLNNIGITYVDGGRYDMALHFHFESLRERERYADSTDISVALNNIGVCYGELGDHENALKYYTKSYEMKIRNNIDWDIVLTLSNIGGELVELGRYAEAEKKFEHALQKCMQRECSNGTLVDLYATLGAALVQQKRAGKATLEKSLQLSASSGLLKQNARCHYWLAQYEFQNNNLPAALNHLSQTKRNGEFGGPNINAQILRLYSLIYARMKEYERAFDYQNRYLALSQEIINGNLVQRVATVQVEFQERENLAKLASQANILELQSTSIERQKILNLLTWIVVLMALGLIIVLVRNIWQKKKINLLLDLRIRERTSELESNRDQLQHAYDQQAIVISKLSSEFNSAAATLRGLTSNAEIDLPEGQAIYFRQAGIVADKLASYANSYSARPNSEKSG